MGLIRLMRIQNTLEGSSTYGVRGPVITSSLVLIILVMFKLAYNYPRGVQSRAFKKWNTSDWETAINLKP